MGLIIENNVVIKHKEEAGITEVVIPEDVTSIGHGAFEDCSYLTIHAPKGSYAIQYAVENKIGYHAI